MNERGGETLHDDLLRHRAEQKLAEVNGEDGQPSLGDVLRMFHELQVHQIELEMQNEELARARDEVEAGLERYASLYEFAPVGYFTLDERATIIDANLTGATLLGVERSLLLGQRFDLFVDPDDRAIFRAISEEMWPDDVQPAYELRLSPARHVMLKAETVGLGRHRLAVMDITERKQAEQTLQSEQELAAIFANAPIIMFLVDQDLRIIKSNQRTLGAAKREGFELELSHKRYAEALNCIHYLDDPRGCGFGPTCQDCTLRRTVLDTFNTGKSWRMVEATLRRDLGDQRDDMFFLVSTTLVGDERNRRVLVCIDDITERKQAEEELRAYQRNLGELAAELFAAEEGERRRIAANLHDTVVQYLGLSSQKLKLLRAGQDEAGPILDEVIEHLDQAIADSRDLIGELSPPVLYIIGLAPALEKLAHSFGERRHLRVDLFLGQLPQPLSMPLNLFLYRACAELLNNVVKHARCPRAQVRLELVGDYVYLSVADGGPGFAYSDEIYETHHKFGLFNIREMLRGWQGRLLVEQPPGGGAKITLAIPAASCWPVQKVE